MNAQEQRQQVLDLLERRERIAAETEASLQEREFHDPIDPLANIDPSVREAAEDEFYARQGRRRYRTSDGRTLFLKPEEIAQRRRARSQGSRRPKPRFYGPSGDDRRRVMLTWGFNVAAVVLALLIVAIILH